MLEFRGIFIKLMVLIMKIRSFFSRLLSVCLIYLFLCTGFLIASHNTSRYFPFVERPEEIFLRNRSHISPSIFFAKASTAFKRGGGNTGIPELWGKYDLRDVINSLEVVTGATNPIIEEQGPASPWIDQEIKFRVDGKVKAKGLLINYQQDIGWNNISVGASIPIMHVNNFDRFAFLESDSAMAVQNLNAGELAQLDRIKRRAHNLLDLKGGDWVQTGLGDLDVQARCGIDWDHVLMMRRIDLVLQSGFTVPFGSNSDIDYPCSVSFMGNGHWSIYFDGSDGFHNNRQTVW